jgi:signal transduction histidine kinase
MDLLHARSSAAATVDPSGAVSGASLLPPRVSRDLALALDAIVLLGVARTAPTLAAPRAAVWLAALAFAVTFPLATLRPLSGRSLAAVVALWGVCGVVLESLTPRGAAILLIVVAIMQASRVAEPLGPALALCIGLGYEASAILATRTFDLGGLLSSALGLVFAYLAAAGFRRLREEKHKTEALLQEVLAGRDAQVRAATLDERARLAREIHDILAHTLSALAVQLEGTRLLVEQRPGDPAAVAALERASGLARDGLEETKQAVSALRGDALPSPEGLPDLAAAFERDTAVPCRVTVEGAPVAPSPEAQLALYRTAQEALTNVRKHAVASAVAISLRYGMDAAELTVEDEGAPRPVPLPGSGNGLNGMRERAALARGRLEAGPTPTGFRVHLWLPA